MKTYYNEKLTELINKSGLSLGEISARAKKLGVQITTSYISKLKNGHMPAPSFEISYILSEILNGDPYELIALGLVDRSQKESLELMNLINKYNKEKDEDDIFMDAQATIHTPSQFLPSGGIITKVYKENGVYQRLTIEQED
ncbi:helix-turn-helix transcriptional regulator [Listeria seeligeri]|uniref:helix-turn-helix domain-containing protein n=1 Tax=Listeria seeligeri TaxID=1640 RepID=UPI001887ADE6|nr:helix-turn-helix transcriptional regulator [Listeria seeligeri]MBF2604209.1 helix-turn-helix transcriptional regulator [Listeria seeligeri]